MEPGEATAHDDRMEPTAVADTASADPVRDPALRSVWEGWARRTVTADPASASRSAEAAVGVVEAGGSSDAAVVAGFVAAGVWPPTPYLRSLDIERWRLGELLAELAQLGAWSEGPAEDATYRLAGELRHRLTVADQVAVGVASVRPTPAGWGTGPGGPTGPADPPAGPGGDAPGAGDQGVRILGATGVFLLLTATLLFEVLGVPGRDHLLRFLAVTGLEGVLIGAGLACGRSERFRTVAGIYVAASALVLPVVVAAGLAAVPSGVGLRPATAVAVGALGCVAVYAWLALLLPSRAYACLALLAVGTGWVSGAVAAGLDPTSGWTAPTVACLAALYLVVDALAVHAGRARSGDPRWEGAAESLTGPAPWFVAASGGVAGVVALSAVDREYLPGWSGPLALSVLAVAFGLAARQPGRHRNLVPAMVAGSAAVLSAGPWLAWGRLGTSVALDGLALGTAAVAAAATGAGRTGGAAAPEPSGDGGPMVGGVLRVLAVVEATAVLLSVEGRSWWAPVVLVVAAGVPAWTGWRTGEAAWSGAAVPLAVAAWFTAARLAVSALGPPASGSLDPLAAARLLGPLPVVLVAVGLALRGRQPGWSRAIHTLAAGLGALVVSLTLAGRAPVAAGSELLVAWAAVAGVSSIERWTPPLPAGAGAGMSGAALVVLGLGGGVELALTATLGVVLLEYAWGSALRDGRGDRLVESPGRVHRITALVGAVTVLTLTLVRLAAGLGHGAPVAALLAVVVAATLVGMEARQPGGAWWSTWAALGLASLAALPVAAASGTHNPQWYVLAPGVTLLLLGLRLPDEPRDPHGVRHGRWLTGTGAALLLGTTAGLAAGGGGGGPVVLLVVEGALLVVTGVGLQRRVPVVAGAIGVAVGGLSALSLVPSTLALSLLIGVVGVAVLIAATVLMAGGRHLAHGRQALRQAAWSRWR